MADITCLRELEEKRVLELDDIVEFTVNKKNLKYKVCFNHLWIKGFSTQYNNNKIFKILKIDKIKITEKAYGYEIIKHNDSDIYFPQYRNSDFLALTRLVVELYRIIEKREPVYTKFTRFEIMEI